MLDKTIKNCPRGMIFLLGIKINDLAQSNGEKCLENKDKLLDLF
jgi:hypothetical protein